MKSSTSIVLAILMAGLGISVALKAQDDPRPRRNASLSVEQKIASLSFRVERLEQELQDRFSSDLEPTSEDRSGRYVVPADRSRRPNLRPFVPSESGVPPRESTVPPATSDNVREIPSEPRSRIE